MRGRVVTAVESGLSRRRAAERCGVSGERDPLAATRARSLHASRQDEGGERRAAKIEKHAVFILKSIVLQPDPTLAEWRDMLSERGLTTSIATLRRFFRPTRDHAQKKTDRPTEQDSPHVLKRREERFDGEIDLDINRLEFLDVTWASTKMARRHGRCRRGQRLPARTRKS